MAAVVPPLIVLAFISKMSEKHKYTPLRVSQVKNQQQTISTEKKLDVKSRPEKGE